MQLQKYLEVFVLSLGGIPTVLAILFRSNTYGLSKSRYKLSSLTYNEDSSVLDCGISCLMAPKCKGFKFTSGSCQLYGDHQSSQSEQNQNEEKMFLVVSERDGKTSNVEGSEKFENDTVKKAACNDPPVEGSCWTDDKMTYPYVCKNHANISSTWVSKCKHGVWTEFELKFNDHTRCYEVVDGKALYTGNLNVTESGMECQRWDTQTPQKHNMVPEDFFEETLSDAANYCRDPDGAETPWCYTTKWRKRWVTCNVPQC